MDNSYQPAHPAPALRRYTVMFSIAPSVVPQMHVKNVSAWDAHNAQVVALAPLDLRPTSKRVFWHAVTLAADTD